MKNNVTTLADLQPDQRNANKGTERGRHLLQTSIRKLGTGRSILLDKNNKIVAGNKTVEVAASMGIENVRIIETDGTEIIAVKRMNLDLDTEDGRLMAYADNRVGQVDLDFDIEEIIADVNAGLPLGDFWFESEIDQMIARLSNEVNDPNAEWQGMPEFEQEAVSDNKITVYFADDNGRSELASILGQAINLETKFIWFPKDEKPMRQNNKLMLVEHES